MVQLLQKTVWKSLKKLNVELLYDPVITEIRTLKTSVHYHSLQPRHGNNLNVH